MSDFEHFTSVKFHRFKGFSQYSISLQKFNILVGPNNCGKSTILGAFRILAEGIRKASAKNPTIINGLTGEAWGYIIDLSNIPIATENVFYNYDDSEPATITFSLSNGNKLILFFRETGSCNLICDAQGSLIRSPSYFKKAYNAPIGFVPVLGPVEHNENLYQKEAARLALLTHRASRNFRNIWYHYPDEFDDFRSLLKRTWPGMDIEQPEIDHSHSPVQLHMFCPEERIPREIYWAGFGFQVWCQMLTYIIRGRNSSLFIIDEPDIYLHSDLQRQLIGILRSLGPDILIATHSTEIISEAEPNDLVVVNKRQKSAKRIHYPGELQPLFRVLGSNLNPFLTQLAKTKRVLFVEGDDFQMLSRFARKLGNDRVANRADFAVVQAEGFNTSKVRDFIQGIETTIGTEVLCASIFDRDYRSDAESAKIKQDLEEICRFAHIHNRKEIENFLLHPVVLTRAINARLAEQNKRTGKSNTYEEKTIEILNCITEELRHKVFARYIEKRKPFERSQSPGLAEETILERLMAEYDRNWTDIEQRLRMVPGKEILSALNSYLQQNYGVNVTPALIIDSFKRDEVDQEMISLIAKIDSFIKEQAE